MNSFSSPTTNCSTPFREEPRPSKLSWANISSPKLIRNIIQILTSEINKKPKKKGKKPHKNSSKKNRKAQKLARSFIPFSPIKIPLPDYVSTVFEAAESETSTIVQTIFNVFRFLKRAKVALYPKNFHLVFLTASFLTTKFNEEKFFSLKSFAGFGCASYEELKTCEELFMEEMGYSLFVEEEEYSDYVKFLLRYNYAVDGYEESELEGEE